MPAAGALKSYFCCCSEQFDTSTSDPADLEFGPADAGDIVHEDVAGIHTVQDLLSRLQHCQAGSLFDLQGATLHLTADWKAKADTEPIARRQDGAPHSTAQLCCGGGQVANATLCLGDPEMLAFHSSARVKLRNVVIQGGLLLCSGPQCRLALAEVTLEAAGLRVLGGATATVHDMHARQLVCGEPPAAAPPHQYAVFVWDAGTAVHARDVHMDRGVYVHSGAKFTADGVTVRLGAGAQHGVLAQGEGTRAVLKHADIRLAADVPAAGHTCVFAEANARVELSRAWLKKAARVVEVQSGARATLWFTGIAGTTEYAIKFRRGWEKSNWQYQGYTRCRG